MKKIFITGFKHSGTTMLHQLIKAHPQVGWIENEEGYIEFDEPKEWVLMHASKRVWDFKKYAWGEKLPWSTRETDVNGKRAINNIKKWLKFFKGKARVLHIVRHPVDATLSGLGESTTVGKEDWKFITTSVPKVIEFTNHYPSRCATISYEDLVYQPAIYLTRIINFLGLDVNNHIINTMINAPLKFGKINSNRAFNYKIKGIESDFDYKALLNKSNNRL